MEILGKLTKKGQYEKGRAIAKVFSWYSKMIQNDTVRGEGSDPDSKRMVAKLRG